MLATWPLYRKDLILGLGKLQNSIERKSVSNTHFYEQSIKISQLFELFRRNCCKTARISQLKHKGRAPCSLGFESRHSKHRQTYYQNFRRKFQDLWILELCKVKHHFFPFSLAHPVCLILCLRGTKVFLGHVSGTLSNPQNELIVNMSFFVPHLFPGTSIPSEKTSFPVPCNIHCSKQCRHAMSESIWRKGVEWRWKWTVISVLRASKAD